MYVAIELEIDGQIHRGIRYLPLWPDITKNNTLQLQIMTMQCLDNLIILIKSLSLD